MPVVDLTAAELRYLAKMNAESLRVMEFMKTKGQSLPDLPLAQQLHAKFTALLPEGVPDVFAEHMEIGVDIREQMMEITPSMHHMMGGFAINEWGQTNVAGLYAIGGGACPFHCAAACGGWSV